MHTGQGRKGPEAKGCSNGKPEIHPVPPPVPGSALLTPTKSHLRRRAEQVPGGDHPVAVACGTCARARIDDPTRNIIENKRGSIWGMSTEGGAVPTCTGEATFTQRENGDPQAVAKRDSPGKKY